MRNHPHQSGQAAEIRLKTHLIKEGMPGHVKDVHFDLSVSNLHPGNTREFMVSHTCVEASETMRLNLLGDAVVNADRGQVLGHKPFLTVAFDDAALGNNIMEQGTLL